MPPLFENTLRSELPKLQRAIQRDLRFAEYLKQRSRLSLCGHVERPRRPAWDDPNSYDAAVIEARRGARLSRSIVSQAVAARQEFLAQVRAINGVLEVVSSNDWIRV